MQSLLELCNRVVLHCADCVSALQVQDERLSMAQAAAGIEQKDMLVA